MKPFKNVFLLAGKKTLISLVGFIILFQLFIFVADTEYNKHVDNTYYRELLIEQVIILAQRLQTTPTDNQQQIIDKTHLPDTRFTLDTHPHWPIQLDTKSLWNIYNQINPKEKHIKLSIQLKDDVWLNVWACVLPSASKLQTYLIIFEIFTTLIILMLLWKINSFTISFQEIARATHRLGSDLNVKPLTPSGPSIVRNTLQSINHLQERVQNLLHERMQMIAAISHDLRTPMTRIRLRSEYITDPEQYEKNVQDLDEMEAMISETLSFVRDDHQREPKNTIDLTALLISLCNDFSDAGHNVIYSGSEKILPMQASSLALKRAFTNIIDNAVKYAGSAEVSLHECENGIHVVVSDSGPGLTDEQLEQVFTPFYRVNKSRSRRTGGTGLGLTIARNIILTHNGKLSLERRDPHGLIATVIF